MDVQTLTGTSSVAGPSSGGIALAELVAPPVASVTPAGNNSTTNISPNSTSSSSQVAPPKQQPGISPAIAKIFGSGAPLPKEGALNVSYRVVKDPNEIVIVFTDPKTGKEVAQFPPELFAQLAVMLDHQQGATLDQNA